MNSKLAGAWPKFALRRTFLPGALLAVLIALVAVPSAHAQSGAIVLDGLFDDWLGQANIPDVLGDSQTNPSDLSAFYFTNNPDQDYLYFMAERWEASAAGLELRLSIDTNNNGDYSETTDRYIEVRYHPNQDGRTYVDLFDGQGSYLNQVAYQMKWGESGKGSRVEWGVTLTDLGIAPFQTIRMQLASLNGIQISDGAAEVQWSPANALGWYLLSFLTLGGLGWMYYRRREIA